MAERISVWVSDELEQLGVTDIDIVLVRYDGQSLNFEVCVSTREANDSECNIQIARILRVSTKRAVESIAKNIVLYTRDQAAHVEVDIGFYTQHENN